MSSKAPQSEAHLHRGQYLGEISALCFLHLPSRLSSLPLLLAGTGSQILVYDLLTGKMIRSFQVFEGIRVHGIFLDNLHTQLPGFRLAFRVAVFGERRVKLFSLQIKSDSGKKSITDMDFTLTCSLPKFGHWVLDVSFLKDGSTSSEDACYLAIGCSDNTVYFWNMLTDNMFSTVKCTERCLLYSMRMLGSEIESLRIASGTIFNEIVVWKVVSQNHTTVVESYKKDCKWLANDGDLFPHSKYKDALVCRLVGHEGSIFRIAWFSNGMKLVSVSDDRSARIWELHAEKESSCKTMQDGVNQSGLVLFGHNARIWDCCIFDSVIITAGEDCTCRVWDHDGRELNKIKEHIGRGVWRCLYDPSSSLLVTAGFDSAIKVHQLYTSSGGLERTLASQDIYDRKEVFSLFLPNSSVQGGLMDSKSEYVRCLHFAREDSLYVATNNGYLYHASLYDDGAVEWTELRRINEEAPVICMNLLSKCSHPGGGFEDWVALGDGKGSMTIIQVVGAGWSRRVEVTLTWPAEKERHLLGIYWCQALGNRFIFTSDPSGRLKLWKLCDSLSSASLIAEGSNGVSLIAEYASCFGMRIMCVDASFDEELIVCGDIRGNLLLFSLPRSLVSGTSDAAEMKTSPLNYFKGAHGLSSVSCVSIFTLSSDQVEICSTGADGCICYLKHDRDLHNFEFMGMKQVKLLSIIQSVYATTVHSDDSVRNYAVGFSSANFIIWNLTSGTKVLQIGCGGWRRPHSYYLGELPEMMNCFSFVKDNVIHIHRHWVPEIDRQIYPQNLHLQFHGKEIHTVCFIHGHSMCYSCENQVSEWSWIATGCEDGSVRLTRYEPGMQNWSSSQYLGEHVGGSAVRSVCSVSKMHIFIPDSFATPNVVYGQNGASDVENPSVLISVGAKRVVTAWKQIVRMNNHKLDLLSSEMDLKIETNLNGSSKTTISSFSFQWLSTDMPHKHSTFLKRNNTKEFLETTEDHSTTASNAASHDPLSSRYRNLQSDLCLEDNLENDWRYLDVTAFLVKEAGSRISTCFIVVACSDATVTLKALLLPFRMWFDVASLALLSSPVLSLQHIVIPKHHPSEGEAQTGSIYWVITGSTDGSIAIWDLTECVESFMHQISGLQMENCMELQKRPRTGRGSQGGRWWRCIDNPNARKKPGHCMPREKNNTDLVSVEEQSDNKMDKHVCETSKMAPSKNNYASVPLQDANPTASVSGRKNDVKLSEMVISAMYVLDNVHQSGVNCLHASDVQDLKLSDSSGLSFYVVSGGDDQAINFFRCDLERVPVGENSWNTTLKINCNTLAEGINNQNHLCLIQNHQMQFLYLDKIISAHNSAVKGAWTDGIWAFSVGLDQRVRCWDHSNGRLTECAHVIVSVPEPEALDVKACGRNHYQIAVAGRGMQMIEFYPSNIGTGGM